MIIKPKVRGFICTNAHPEGCAKNVAEQIDYVRSQNLNGETGTPKNVLVVGSSTGYGLASRITAAYGFKANTLGVFFEKPPTEKRTGTAGFYNSAAFEAQAYADGLYAKSINGDAFSHECKQRAVELIKQDMGSVDLVVYSLASPRRTDPETGITHVSTLKPIGEAYTAKNLNTDTQIVGEITVEPANEEEIANTIKVMGGEDWALWMKALSEAGVLSEGAKTVAYTYIGDQLTKPVYGHATIGRAKEHLDETAQMLRDSLDIQATVSVLKAVVTQSSSAIPVMPLYLSILFKHMKEEGTHEGCIEQLARLFSECIYAQQPRVDDEKRFRVDELEMRRELQASVEEVWPQVNTENLHELSDFSGYQAEFLKLFGFGRSDVNYDAEIAPMVDNAFIDLA